MKTFFDPVITKIKKLLSQMTDEIQDKVQLKVNVLYIVGGFAQNDYVFSQLERWADKARARIYRCNDA